jgi:hypothetical protein
MTDVEQQKQLRESIEAIADRAAAKAVRDVMVTLGIDVSNPIIAQAQFAALRELSSPRTMDNLQWLETLHAASQRVADTSWKTFIRLMVTAAFGLVAVVTREYWMNHFWK